MAEFMGNSYSFNTEKRLESLNQRINNIESMNVHPKSMKHAPYDPNVAKANPIANPSAIGNNVNPAQAQQFQAMMQMMQAKMLSSGLGNNNDNNQQSGLESMMQGFGMQGMGGVPGIGGIPGAMPQMNGMAVPGAMQQMNGMTMPNQQMQPGMGMQGIDPALLQQMSQIQMMKNY
ncbi:MAG: hypothetical protein MK033_05760 [Candidatus Caenarcaniphilales bacterium]|nr:hypothetical protein [Candidatus Caenarcaniphilales bacterium]